MKKIILLFLLLFGLTVCSGKSNMPYPEIEYMGQDTGKYIRLLNKTVQKVELDVSRKGTVLLILHGIDDMQIGEKIHHIPWRMIVRLPENSYFMVTR